LYLPAQLYVFVIICVLFVCLSFYLPVGLLKTIMVLKLCDAVVVGQKNNLPDF